MRGPLRPGGTVAHSDRHRRGVRRVHSRRHGARTAWILSAPTTMSWCCGRSRRHTGWGPERGLRGRPPRADHRPRQGLRALHRVQPLAGRCHRVAGRRRRTMARTDALVAERARVSAALRDCRVRITTVASRLRLAALGPAHAGFRGAGRRGADVAVHTAPTVSASPSPPRRKKTTPSWGSRVAGFEQHR